MPGIISSAGAKPRIALTMGDPAGVGPEICLRALASLAIAEAVQVVVFGDAGVLHQCAQATGLAMPGAVFTELDSLPVDTPCVFDQQQIAPDTFAVGKVAAATGLASYHYIDAAISAALAGRVDAVTTAPINKEAFRAAGIRYPGHTEIFAERARSDRWCMMQFSSEITCTFVTVHVGYAEVPKLLTVPRVLETIELTGEALTAIHARAPKLVVCGLNPHAGEHGLFGNGEEEKVIIPAIEIARERGWQVEGPLPPDTAFLPAKRKVTDGFVCMYHDQGHIPLKALAFDSAVNTTLGLPIIRTSVDHGTAYDIAWQGVASASSLFEALHLAEQLVGLRRRKPLGH
jgi:4-phospho-D-threonate 3-dehydrogenase / 4-phospho-D-erythronate 3-dehydrogenase